MGAYNLCHKYRYRKSGKHIECVIGAEKSVKVKSVRYHEKTGTNKMRQCTVYCNVCSVAYNVCSVAYKVCNGAYNNPKIVQIKRTQSTSITSQILGTMKNTCLKWLCNITNNRLQIKCVTYVYTHHVAYSRRINNIIHYKSTLQRSSAHASHKGC